MLYTVKYNVTKFAYACPLCACIICVKDERKGNCMSCNLHVRVQEYVSSAKFKMEKRIQFDTTFLMSQQVRPCCTERKARAKLLHFTSLSPHSHPAKTQMKLQACQMDRASGIYIFFGVGEVTMQNNVQFVF